MAPTTPNRNATSVVGSPLRRSPRGHQSPSSAAAPSLPARRSPRKLALKWKALKPGLKKGQRISQAGDRRSRGKWYQICHNFRTLAVPPRTKVAFLKGKGFKGNNSDLTSFANYLRQYDKGKLLPNETMKRAQSSKYPQLEERLIQYIDLRAANYSKDKCGVSFTALQARAVIEDEIDELERNEAPKEHELALMDDEEAEYTATLAQDDKLSFAESNELLTKLLANAPSQGMGDLQHLLVKYQYQLRKKQLARPKKQNTLHDYISRK